MEKLLEIKDKMSNTDSENSENERVISVIDPKLKLLNPLKFTSSTKVYRVKKDGGIYVLKISRGIKLGTMQLENERTFLPCLADVQGITHIAYDYGNTQRGDAILKEYADGEMLHYFCKHSGEEVLIQKLKSKCKKPCGKYIHEVLQI